MRNYRKDGDMKDSDMKDRRQGSLIGSFTGSFAGNFLTGILLAGILLAGVFLAGCADRGEQAQSQETHMVTGETHPVLDFYIWSDEETYVKQVVDAYNMLKGYEMICLHVIPNGEHEEWLKNYTAKVGGDILGLRGNANLVEQQQKGNIIPLGDYLKSGELDVTAYGNMFNESIYQGEYYALPTRSTCWELFYNKELFDEAGVPYPEQMTWEEYLKLAEQMTSQQDGEPIWGGYFPPWIYHFTAIQKGYYLLDDNLEPMRESLELLQRMYSSGSHMPYEDIVDRGDDCRWDFEKGNIAMMVNGEWMVNMLLEDEASGRDVPEWDVAPMPVPEGVEPGTTVGMYQFAAVTSTCEYPEEAFEFLCFLCGENGARIYARNAIIPAYSNEEIRQIYAEAAGTENAGIFFEARKVQEQPMWEGYEKLLELFKKDARNYLEGKCTLDDAIGHFESERKNALKQNG